MTDLKTSAEWHVALEKKYPGSYVMDPDGWDRRDYNYSFYEEDITQEEFLNRFTQSTVAMSREFLNDMIAGKEIQL
jgi:hypothetical protein